jgi:hypothetical protein
MYAQIFRQLDKVQEAAAKLGCAVVLPEDNQLLLDLDTEEQYRHFIRFFVEMQNLQHSGATWTGWPSRSGVGKHVVVTIPGKEFSHEERVAYEVMLGSDPKRAAYGMLRVLAGDNSPGVLFKPIKEAA